MKAYSITLHDLQDCYENMDNPEDLSRDELNAKDALIALCYSIGEYYIALKTHEHQCGQCKVWFACTQDSRAVYCPLCVADRINRRSVGVRQPKL